MVFGLSKEIDLWQLDNVNGYKFIWETATISFSNNRMCLYHSHEFYEREIFIRKTSNSTGTIVLSKNFDKKAIVQQSEFKFYEVNLINLLVDNFTECINYFITPSRLQLYIHDRVYSFYPRILPKL